jgi:ABC-type nitrate/sulfonate/bicarbonate transport system substrate-binding protein
MDVYPFGAFYAMEAIARGEAVYIFGGTAWEGTEILAKDGGEAPDVARVEDLRGARIASASTEQGCLALMDELERRGWREEVTLTYVPSDKEGIAGVLAGNYDYYLCNNAAGYFAEALGLRVAGTVNDIVADYPCCTLESSKAAYTGKRDALVRFMRAVLRGFADYRDDPEGTVATVAEFTGMDADFTRASLYGKPGYRNVMRLDPALEPETLSAFYESLLREGLITGNAPLAPHVVMDVYEKALQP